MPSTTIAFIPRWPKASPAVPPAFASLTPPVSGLLPPTDNRPAVATPAPPKRPGAKINLLCLPNASQSGGISSSSSLAINARPPRRSYTPGTGTVLACNCDISTRISFIITPMKFRFRVGRLPYRCAFRHSMGP